MYVYVYETLCQKETKLKSYNMHVNCGNINYKILSYCELLLVLYTFCTQFGIGA